MAIETTTDATNLSEKDAIAALAQSSLALILTNPLLADNPIVYVNSGFERLTGYSRGEVLGRNCRFLQGEATERERVAELRAAIAAEREVSVDLTNYRADGSAFTNRLLVTPVRDEDGATTYFLGIQQELSGLDTAQSRAASASAISEIQHRVKNHLAMLTSFIRMQARESGASQAFSSLAQRVESLQLLYDELSHPAAGQPAGTVALDQYLARVAHAVASIDDSRDIRVAVDLVSATVNTTTAVQIGLLTSEVLTNAMQHAFPGRESGRLELTGIATGERGLRIVVVDDGVGLPEDGSWPDPDSLGGRIVEGLVEGLDGTLDVAEESAGGTRVILDIPAARET